MSQFWRCHVVPIVSVLIGSLALAQGVQEPSPLLLIRGLREQGHADLALIFLAEQSAKWPAAIQKEMLLERAKCRLDLASEETDESDRMAALTLAKQEFDAFLAGNANHPRLPEAAVARARLFTLEGQAELLKAKRISGDGERKQALANARPFFTEAAKRYRIAASGLEQLVKQDTTDAARARELTREYYQAQLDEGINFMLIAESYLNASGADIDQRDKAAKSAQQIFEKLGQRDDSQPVCWVAKAWYAESFLQLGERVKSEQELKKMLDEARKKLDVPAAAAGFRMARFFALRELFVKGDDPASRNATMTACRAWLADYPSAKPNTETFATQYYLGTTLLNDGLRRENLIIERGKPDKPGEPVPETIAGVLPDGLNRLREADRLFRVISSTENDYTDRAQRQRAKAIRWLVGNADRPASAYANFDECYMAALLQLDKTRGEGDASQATGKSATLNRAVELLERARELPVPKESARDGQQALLTLAQTYNTANRPYQAAVLGESQCRQAKSPKQIARFGAVALFGYDLASKQVTADQAEALNADRERMLSLAGFVVRNAPNESLTDDVRLQLSILYSQLSAAKPMFETLVNIPNSYSRLATARLFEGIAAYELLKPRTADDTAQQEELTPQQRADVLKRAIADLTSVPAALPTAKRLDALDYFSMRLQLAQLHLLNVPDGYVQAEATAKSALDGARTFPDLPDVDKKRLLLRTEAVRVRAVYAQAMKPFLAGQYAAAAEKLAPLLADIVKAGPAATIEANSDVIDDAKRLDADRIRLVLVPVLNARLREGAVEKTSELLDQLRKFGGDLTVTARVVQQGVASIKPVVDGLRAEGKAEEANKLIAATNALVGKLTSDKNLPPEVLLNFGRTFQDLGELAKSSEFLERVPEPGNKAYLGDEPKPDAIETATPDEKRKLEQTHEANKTAASLYRQARLELLRNYRMNQQFDKADALLDATLGVEAAGKDGLKDRIGGWATKYFDFRREYLYLLDARATATKTWKQAAPLFNQAIKLWSQREAVILGELTRLNKPLPQLRSDLQKLQAEATDGQEVGATLAKTQQQIGELERKMLVYKPIWHDTIVEKWKVQAGAFLAESKSNPNKKLEDSFGKLATAMAEFEKSNTPLAESVHNKLHQLLASQPVLLAAYAKKGGTAFAKPVRAPDARNP